VLSPDLVPGVPDYQVVLERPEPADGATVIKFRLVVRGQLPPDKRGMVNVKHRIRRELHPQLRTLWKQHMLLQDAFRPSNRPKDGRLKIERIADNFSRCGFRFVPLVRKEFISCALNILLMRRDEPHQLFTGAGDIDSRVKTLLDGLRLPNQCSEVADCAPTSDEDPFFCLLEDDRSITSFSVTGDTLLTPAENGEPESLSRRPRQRGPTQRPSVRPA